VLSDVAEITYHVTGAEYTPSAEAGIHWDDPTLSIDWPVKTPLLSEKDRNLPLFESLSP